MDTPRPNPEPNAFQRLLWDEFVLRGESMYIFTMTLDDATTQRTIEDLEMCARDRMFEADMTEAESSAITRTFGYLENPGRE